MPPASLVFYGGRLAYDPNRRPIEWTLRQIPEEIKMLCPQHLFLDYCPGPELVSLPPGLFPSNPLFLLAPELFFQRGI